jgi:ribosomal protein L31
MYASTAVNNDSAGIPQAYVNQDLIKCNGSFSFEVTPNSHPVYTTKTIQFS